MNIRPFIPFATMLTCGLLTAGVVAAESVWVSDQFEVMLRTGPSTSNAIERVLRSGTKLESLETDRESG